MSDETQIPSWARDAGLVAIVGAVAGVVRAFVRGVVRVVGSRRERDAGVERQLAAATEQLTAANARWQELEAKATERAEAETRRADDAEQRVAECEAGREELRQAYDGITARVIELERQLLVLSTEHAGCPARIAHLESAVEEHRQTIGTLKADLDERQSTPPESGGEE